MGLYHFPGMLTVKHKEIIPVRWFNEQVLPKWMVFNERISVQKWSFLIWPLHGEFNIGIDSIEKLKKIL